MGTVSVLRYSFVFYLHLIVCSKLTRLEKRVDIMEEKMCYDSKAFKADIADIFEKLDNIIENTSHSHIELRPTASSDLDEGEADSLLMLVKKAVHEEKKYIRNVVKELRDELLRKIESHMNLKKINDILFDQISALDTRINSSLLEMSKNKGAINDMIVSDNHTKNELQNSIELVSLKLDSVKDIEQKVKSLNKKNDVLTARIDCHSQSWYSFGQSCYHIENRDPQTWAQANERCKLLNASLAEVESEEENSFLIELAKLMTSDSDLYGVYLGGSDLRKEGEWIWEGSRRKIFDVFNNFKGSEPNGGRIESCLHLIRKYSWNWNDISCGKRLSYICENRLSY